MQEPVGVAMWVALTTAPATPTGSQAVEIAVQEPVRLMMRLLPPTTMDPR
jgi:hypothetical protein